MSTYFFSHQSSTLRYTTGYSGEGAVLLGAQRRILLVDPRYTLRAKREARAGVRVVEYRTGLAAQLKSLAGELRLAGLGYDPAELTVAELALLRRATRGVRWVAQPNPTLAERLCKTPAEQKLLRKAGRLAGRVLRHALGCLRLGVTERAIAGEIYRETLVSGAEEVAFQPIVAFGRHTAVPHHAPTQRRLHPGDLVLLDLGVRYGGYCSDLTRTYCVGQPTAQQKAVYQTVYAAYQAGVAAVHVGATAASVDAAARGVIIAAGYGEYFTHATGHGVGLAVHEAPSVSSADHTRLKAGMVITCEPGVYFPSASRLPACVAQGLGVRLEDSLLVCAGTHPEVLTPVRLASQLPVLRF